MKTKPKWATGRTDIESFTHCPDTGQTTRVLYIYREDDAKPRIAVFDPDAVADAEMIVNAVNAFPEMEDFAKHVGTPTFREACDALLMTRHQLQAKLREANLVNKEMGDALERIAKKFEIIGDCNAVADYVERHL